MNLSTIAHGRAGDKTGSANIGVIAIDWSDFEVVGRTLRKGDLRGALGADADQPIQIFELPLLRAFNIWLPGFLDGSVTYTLRHDVFGHNLIGRVLAMEVVR